MPVKDPTTLTLEELLLEFPPKVLYNIFPPAAMNIKPFGLRILRGFSGGYSVAYIWDNQALGDKETPPKNDLVFGDPDLHKALEKLYNVMVMVGYIK